MRTPVITLFGQRFFGTLFQLRHLRTLLHEYRSHWIPELGVYSIGPVPGGGDIRPTSDDEALAGGEGRPRD